MARRKRARLADGTPAPYPFLKWAGGKAQHANEHIDKLPASVGAPAYRETFLGGGAMFFLVFLDVRPAVLSDLNPRLIAAYLGVRDKVEEVIAVLQSYPYDEDFYYAIRDKFNEAPYAPLVQRAAWMIYLNRCCVNGLYRENQAGEFNVGFGKTSNGRPPLICDADNLRACSRALQGADIRCGDFEPVLTDAKEGEVVFLDPPYLPEEKAHGKTKSFTGYTSRGFTHTAESPMVSLLSADQLPKPESDQDRLVRMLMHLDNVGAHWVLTNADTVLSRALYQDFAIEGVEIQRSVSCMGKADDNGAREGKREKAREIIVHGARHGRAT